MAPEMDGLSQIPQHSQPVVVTVVVVVVDMMAPARVVLSQFCLSGNQTRTHCTHEEGGKLNKICLFRNFTDFNITYHVKLGVAMWQWI